MLTGLIMIFTKIKAKTCVVNGKGVLASKCIRSYLVLAANASGVLQSMAYLVQIYSHKWLKDKLLFCPLIYWDISFVRMWEKCGEINCKTVYCLPNIYLIFELCN